MRVCDACVCVCCVRVMGDVCMYVVCVVYMLCVMCVLCTCYV